MEIVTIACPPGFSDPNVSDLAPIWVDANGVEFRIASGLLEGYEWVEPAVAQAGRINIVTGMDGLSALAAMGLTPKDSEGQ
jgi:hypothetical protein